VQALNYSLRLGKSGDQGQSKVANPMKVEAPATTKFTVHQLSAWFGSKQVLHSLNLEINAWFATIDWDEFMLIREETLLSFLRVIEESGTALALPARNVHLVGAASPQRRPNDATQHRSVG